MCTSIHFANYRQPKSPLMFHLVPSLSSLQLIVNLKGSIIYELNNEILTYCRGNGPALPLLPEEGVMPEPPGIYVDLCYSD